MQWCFLSEFCCCPTDALCTVRANPEAPADVKLCGKAFDSLTLAMQIAQKPLQPLQLAPTKSWRLESS
eukprot:364963-Chlamydomonas_euryale.AAC.6